MEPTQQRRRLHNDFENTKNQCLGKRDKSSAGRIDPQAVEICAVINQLDSFYTTSSCSGRCFLYRGPGVKATDHFTRYRVSHDKISDPLRYFNLSTLEEDPTGGGDPIRSVGQYDFELVSSELDEAVNEEIEDDGDWKVQPDDTAKGKTGTQTPEHTMAPTKETSEGESVWFRFEPFILHVACRSMSAAAALMSAARPSFKNVGLTTWKDGARYLVAIWGDEGLDLPLTFPDKSWLCQDPTTAANYFTWLAQLANERHERNWSKIERFVEAVRNMTPLVEEEDDVDFDLDPSKEAEVGANGNVAPRSYDVIGDVAVLHSISSDDPTERQQMGEAIMSKNRAVKLVAVRHANLTGSERAPGMAGLSIIAGTQRIPLITTHSEYGIRCVVDLNNTFFSPRLGRERLRICQQVARGEHVLVLFAGVGMEAFQIAGRTEASSILAIELNEVAVECAHRGHRMLERNKAVKCVSAAERLTIIQGDVLEVLPTLAVDYYDRILAPRPKEGQLDGDLGSGDGGLEFLKALLPVMKQNGGECHWYDFAADHEYPQCERTRRMLQDACEQYQLDMEVLHVAHAGSVAMRQIRVCLDFRIRPKCK